MKASPLYSSLCYRGLKEPSLIETITKLSRIKNQLQVEGWLLAKVHAIKAKQYKWAMPNLTPLYFEHVLKALTA